MVKGTIEDDDLLFKLTNLDLLHFKKPDEKDYFSDSIP